MFYQPAFTHIVNGPVLCTLSEKFIYLFLQIRDFRIWRYGYRTDIAFADRPLQNSDALQSILYGQLQIQFVAGIRVQLPLGN